MCDECLNRAATLRPVVYVTTSSWEVDLLGEKDYSGYVMTASTGVFLATGYDCGTSCSTSS